MEPRLSTSRKWSPIPKELTTQIQSVFRDSFKTELGGGVVETEGKIFPGEILISIGIRKEKSLKQPNFGISIAYNQKKDNVLKLLHIAIDAAASLFEQYFASPDDSEFPRIWEEVDFEKRKIYVIYSTTNRALESEANRLLGKKSAADEEVAQGDWDEDADPELIKASLGIDDDGDGSGTH